MKALSIIQPWAWLIVAGHKDVENRKWHTKHRGRIAIHASKLQSNAEFRFAEKLWERIAPGNSFPTHLEYGAIIGTAELSDCLFKPESPWFAGLYGFVMSNPVVLPEPIPIRGQLGLWTVPKEIEDRLGVLHEV